MKSPFLTVNHNFVVKLRFEFSNEKGTPTSRHLVNKLLFGLSKVQNQIRKKYFRISSGWII